MRDELRKWYFKKKIIVQMIKKNTLFYTYIIMKVEKILKLFI